MGVTLEDYAWFDGCADWITIAEIPAYQIVLEKKSRQRNARLLPQRKMPTSMFARTSRRLGWSKYTRGCTGNDCQRRSWETDYAAFEGSSEGATVADIPGFADAQNEATEESIEEDVVEEEPAPVPAKKGGLNKGGLAKKGASGFGAKKGGLKKGGLAKKGASGFGAKKSGGAATKKGAVKKAAKAASKTTATSQPSTVSEGEISDRGFTAIYILACFFGFLESRFTSEKTYRSSNVIHCRRIRRMADH